MHVGIERQKVHFVSRGTSCAAWHYPGTNGACLIMAPGLAVTKEPGTDPFAGIFQQSGFSVLAFDYRRFGESDGEPRQILKLREQHADMEAAIALARDLPEVDPARIALWGFSLSGGHVLAVAARTPHLAAAIAVSPTAEGPRASRRALRSQTPLALMRLSGLALLDAAGGQLGRQPRLVPLAAERGAIGLISTPDALKGANALNPEDSYPNWRQEVAARAALSVSRYRPGRYASTIRCPLLVLAYEQDEAALAGPAVTAGQNAPAGEVVLRPGGHYESYMGDHDEALRIQLSFLGRHLLGGSAADDRPSPSTVSTG
jgi:pimeloyl-ACP methyl ester carboxylesterase